MEIIFLLIPLSLILAGVAVWAFFWAVRHGQFDDLESPALDILDYHKEHDNNDSPPNHEPKVEA